MILLANTLTWHQPSVWWLVLLILLPLIAWRQFAARHRGALAISSAQVAAELSGTWRTRLMWLPPILRLLAVATLIICLARPQISNSYTLSHVEGIAIQLLVDRSGSMRAIDFELDGKPVDRLVAVKHVANQFVKGDGKVDGRRHDLIGLVSFARYADQHSPLTLDHDYLLRELEKIQMPEDPREDGTAIGDAVGLAVERLVALDRERERGQNQQDVASEKSEQDTDPAQEPGKVIILLTDGENNAGDLDPIQAARIAKAFDIKIYTIGVGTTGQAPYPVVDRFTGRERIVWYQVSIDEDVLREMAEITGGQYFPANDTDTLADIYAQIDELEKTEVQEQRFTDYHELAIQPYRAGWFTLPPLLLIAFGLLGLEVLLRQTVLRRVP